MVQFLWRKIVMLSKEFDFLHFGFLQSSSHWSWYIGPWRSLELLKASRIKVMETHWFYFALNFTLLNSKNEGENAKSQGMVKWSCQEMSILFFRSIFIFYTNPYDQTNTLIFGLLVLAQFIFLKWWTLNKSVI